LAVAAAALRLATVLMEHLVVVLELAAVLEQNLEQVVVLVVVHNFP
jgi:hypothetical protein